MYKNWMNDVQDGSESCTSLEEYKKIAIFESGHRYFFINRHLGFINYQIYSLIHLGSPALESLISSAPTVKSPLSGFVNLGSISVALHADGSV